MSEGIVRRAARTRPFAAALAAAALVGCGHVESIERVLSPYRNCPRAGEAYFQWIPLASRSEHEEAERFAPSDPGNCVLYLVRQEDRYTGKSVRDAYVFLYTAAAAPALPESRGPWWGPSWLLDPIWRNRYFTDTPRELHKAQILPEVFTMWELAPGPYVLDASFSPSTPFARAAVTCNAGGTVFWAVGDKGAGNVVLRRLDGDKGESLVRHRLRSIGIQPGAVTYDKAAIDWSMCP